MCERGEKNMAEQVHDIKERSQPESHQACSIAAGKMNTVAVLICSNLIFAPFWRLSGVYLLTHMTHLWSLNQLVYGF